MPSRASRRIRPVAAGILLLLVPPDFTSGRAAEGGRRDALPLEQVRKAFRQEDPTPLRPLLRGEEKLRVSSPTLGLNTGYYSGDQVSLMLKELFELRNTVDFQFLGDAPSPSRSQQVRALARWTYRQGRSPEVSADLIFTFSHREGEWCLREIRDAR